MIGNDDHDFSGGWFSIDFESYLDYSGGDISPVSLKNKWVRLRQG